MGGENEDFTGGGEKEAWRLEGEKVAWWEKAAL